MDKIEQLAFKNIFRDERKDSIFWNNPQSVKCVAVYHHARRKIFWHHVTQHEQKYTTKRQNVIKVRSIVKSTRKRTKEPYVSRKSRRRSGTVYWHICQKNRVADTRGKLGVISRVFFLLKTAHIVFEQNFWVDNQGANRYGPKFEYFILIKTSKCNFAEVGV